MLNLVRSVAFGDTTTAQANQLNAAADFQSNEKIVLILCGLVGSGKSTFAQDLQTHLPRFRRCNQDDLGDRRCVEDLARRSLGQGLSVCIDRTNFNESQRSYWIEIAREFPGTLIWVIVFDTPYETCAARLRERTSHPTIKTPEQGLSVLSRFAADFEPPQSYEGYDRILYVKPSDHPSPSYTRSDISAILQRVRDSPPIIQTSLRGRPSQSSSGYSSYRGNSFRGRRGQTSYSSAAPRARGAYSSTETFRGWQMAPFRGTSTGLRGRGLMDTTSTESAWRNPSRATEQRDQVKASATSDVVVEGSGTANDSLTID